MSRLIRAALLSLALLILPALASAATYPTYNQPQASADIVGFNIQNSTTASQASHYVSWGQPFVQGKVSASASLTAKIDGATYPAQMDVKTKYSDGTVRYAVITVQAPQLAGSATVKGMLSLGGSAGSPVNLSSALSNYDAKIVLSGGLSSTIDLKTKLLEALGNGAATYWLQGQNATQARVDIPVSSSFHIVVDVTAYADGTFLTDAQFRNDYAMQSTGGNVSYMATISQNGSTVFTSSALTHHIYKVWRRVFHTNGAPTSDTHNIQRDVAYYIKAGALPNYDLSSGISDGAIGNVSSTNIAPLSNPGIEKAMPTTGHRDDIGPMPGWHAIWLKSQNANAAKTAIAMGNGGGGIPWHHFDPTTKDYVSLDKYPTLWIDDGNRGEVDLKPAVTDSSWTLDTAHTPDIAFIPYLFTGDRYFLDEVNAQASRQVMAFWPAPRENGKGIVFSDVQNDTFEVRAQGWTFRNITESAWANPDGSTAKAYWQKIANNNYDFLLSSYIPDANTKAKEVTGFFSGAYRGDTSAFTIAPWQQDYVMSGLVAAAGRGDTKAKQIVDWATNWNVGRFTHQAQGLGWAAATSYQFIASTPSGVLHDTWAELGGSNGSSNTLVSDGTDFVTLPLMTLANIYNTNGNADALRVYNEIKAKNLKGFLLSDYQGEYAQFHVVPKSGGVTPTPTPEPTPTPADKFVIGDRIATTDNVNVRGTASPTGTLLGTKTVGSLGSVIGGPTVASGYTWWNVNYDTAPDGWSAEDYLAKSTAPPATTPPPTGNSCPRGTSFNDGCANAPTGVAPQKPTLLNSYGTRRPAWNVAGVDYGVGPTANTVFKNPSTISMAGVSVSASTVTISGNNVTLDGYDFGSRGIFVTGQNARITNSKFAGGTIETHYGTGNASNLYIGYNIIDGQNASGFLINQNWPGLTLEYNWLKNSAADLIGRHGNTGGDVTIRYNLTEQAGMGGAGTHGDYLQVYGPNIIKTTVAYNTSYQAGGTTQGWIMDNTGSADLNNNVMVGSVSYWASISGPNTSNNLSSFTGPVVVRDNYFDVSDAYGFQYPSNIGANDSGPITSYINNVDMVTGEIYQDSGTPTTPAPTVTLSASPTSITSGNSSALTWSSTNATACTASGGWTGTKATSGTLAVTPATTATYTLTCTGAGGSVAAITSVVVTAAPVPTPTTTPSTTPTVTIAANPTTITLGQSIKLTWSSTNVTSCTASGSWTGKKKLNNTRTFSPTKNATYTLTCTGKNGSAAASATVTVDATTSTPTIPAPTPTPTPTPEPTPTPVTETLILGNTTTGTVTDSNDFNSLEATKFKSGSMGGTVQSMSVYVAKPISSAPNNKYSLAIYADNGGTPGALIAQAGNGTLTGDAWNTLSITATIQPNTTYWLVYNNNGTAATYNNFRMSSGSANQVRWRPHTFGTWPQNYGNSSGSDAYAATIYLTYTSGEVLGAATTRFTSTLAQTWTGVEVAFLQNTLKQLGFFTGEATGYFGTQTAAAVSAFQTANGLEAVGIVGPKTRALLNR